MKHLHIYIYIISILYYSTIIGQESKVAIQDTLPPSEKYGLRAGIDISRLIRTAISKSNNDKDKNEYIGLELVADYRFYKDFYAAIELGNESLTRKETNINAKGSGSYIRIGFDYNSYKNWYGMQNNIYIGLRYGFSIFDQRLNSYRIFSSSNYFPEEVITQAINTESPLKASWAEFIFGLKVELIKNIYLGASVSIRRIISEEKPDLADNLFIPGYGKTNDVSNFGVGYNYTISYLIPFTKKKR